MPTTEFYADMGAIIWWIFFKFCQSNVMDEMAEKNKVRNLIVAGSFNFLLALLFVLFLINYS
jgi:hypothetical protein